MAKLVSWLVLLIALNLLLELLTVYGADVAGWITFVLVAVIGVLLVVKKA